MNKAKSGYSVTHPALPKAATGIQGLDEITGGGLPRGRPTLICGSAGCGKTLLAIEFLVRGATQFDEPGVFMAFEETAEELAQNVRSLGFDLDQLAAENKLLLDYVHVERSEIEETGEYDLEGLFIRLGHAIDSIGAKRVVLDTIETLFGGLGDTAVLRAELRRLFRWLKDKGVTAIITGERGEGTLTRQGLEEYVSDCVIVLDHRVSEQYSTRRLRIVKYRGSLHGTNEYPFLIDENGISVLPITSLGLRQVVSNQRISTGIPRLDTMLGGEGLYRGSSVLISGTAGTGKTSLAAYIANASCLRGERCLYLAFEESADQIIRNMKSIGTDLAPWVKKGTLKFHASRPSLYWLEMHLVTIHNLIADFKPRIVIVDPVSNLTSVGTSVEVKSVLSRLFDYLKMNHITTLLTDLVHFGNNLESTNEEISSLIDTWILLRDIEINGERNRGLYILKSRGMAHSNQIREVLLSDRGIELVDVYLGAGGVVTGSARAAQEAKEKEEARDYQHEADRIMREHERKRKVLEAKIEALRAEFDMESEELRFMAADQKKRRKGLIADRAEMARLRKADRSKVSGKKGKGKA